MRPTKALEFKLDCFDDLNDEFEYFPRGSLLEVSVNPFTGNVLVSAQKTEQAKKVLHAIFDQMNAKPEADVHVFKPRFVPNSYSEVA